MAAVVALFGYAPVQAQFARLITYQGVLKDNTGALVNGTPNINFELFDAGGASVWFELQLAVPVKNGLFSVQLGSAMTFPTALDFNQDYYLEIQYPVGTPLAPRTRLTAAPYSMRARIADSVVGGNGSTLWEINAGNARLLTPNTTKPVLIGTGTAPSSNAGRLNVAGNSADNATVHLTPVTGATTPQTGIYSEGVSTTTGSATGIYIDNVVATGGGANGIRVPTVTSTMANAWGLRLSLVEAANLTGTSTGIEISSKSMNGASIGLDAIANSSGAVTPSYGVRGCALPMWWRLWMPSMPKAIAWR